MNQRRIRLLDVVAQLLLVLCLSVSAAVFAEAAHAQGGVAPAIRVESNEVLIPILVLDKKKLDAVRRMDLASYTAESNDANSHLLLDLAVTGLTVDDFRVFEDGLEQKIERITLVSNSTLRAELASSTGLDESISSDSPFLPSTVVREPDWPAYLIAYAQPPSPQGKCHEIKIKVNHPDSEVYARSEYCNTTHDPNDSLSGMPLGNRMKANLDSKSPGQMKLFAMAFPSIDGTAVVSTDILLEAPVGPRILPDCTKVPEIGILGLVYSANGNMAARFSGLVFGDLSQHGQSWPVLLPINAAGRTSWCTLYGPRKFATRVDLPPGEYTLRAVIREGNEFGRTEIPITVEKHEGASLAIGNIILGRGYRAVATSQSSASAVSPGHYIPLISKDFEVVPAADTRFQQGQNLNFYLEILSPQPQPSTRGAVELHMRIRDVATNRVVKDLKPADASFYGEPGKPVIPVGAQIDISALPRGSYQVEAQATDSSGQSTPWHSVAFSIE